MGIARSTYYDQPARPIDDTALVEAIAAICEEFAERGRPTQPRSNEPEPAADRGAAARLVERPAPLVLAPDQAGPAPAPAPAAVVRAVAAAGADQVAEAAGAVDANSA